MTPATTDGTLLQTLHSEFQQVSEGNLAVLGAMIAKIDEQGPSEITPQLQEARGRIADLLMLRGEDFLAAQNSLGEFLGSSPPETAPPETAPPETTQPETTQPETAPPEPAPAESVDAASAAPAHQPESLYEKLGGELTIKTVVEAFYDRLLSDPQLAPVFQGVDLNLLKRHQALFISQALGGPKQYDGREMQEAHRGLEITPEQFDRVAGHLRDTLVSLDVSAEDTETILTTIGSLKEQVVSAPGGPPSEASEASVASVAGEEETPPIGEESAAKAAEAAETAPPEVEAEPEDDSFGDIEPELYAEFVDDAMTHLETIEINFLNLETDPENKKIIDDIFRPFHTIKGVSGFLGLKAISEICHDTENLLDEGRKGALEITGRISDLVLEIVDVLKMMLMVVKEEPQPHKAIRRFATEAKRLGKRLQEVRSGAPDVPQTGLEQPPPTKPLGERLMDTNVITQEKLDAAVTSQKEKGGQLGEILMKEQDVKAVDIAHALRDQQKTGKEEQMEVPPGGPAGGPPASDSIRVRVRLLDQLMGLAGELVLGRNQLLQKLDGISDEVHGLNSLLHTMDRITSEVQEAVMQTRMQPLSALFSRFHRVVRDLARSLNKKINLSIEGESVELDKTLIEALTDPLTHLVRNSADHGIETPEVRAAAGKDPMGHLLISAYHEGGRVYVKIKDDGAGIDPEIIKAKAVEKGMITPEKASQMTDREAMRLLFMAGFSTVEKVTGVSGRGVGMDVVISSIQSVGGTVEIESEVGKGTTILLALPLTLAIVPALIVSAGGQRFAIPQTNLLELVYLEGEAAKDAILEVRGAEIYRLRGEMLPLVRLNHVLQLGGEENSPDEKVAENVSIVVMAAGTQQFGLIVERVFDTEEIVVQPLGNMLKDVGVFAGATLMGDGQPALILDITGLMKTAELTVSDDAPGAGMGEESEAAKAARAQEETQTLLVFNINPAEQMAVPLTLISRLETVNVKDIRSSIHGDVIPYRDRLLPLIYMEKHTNISPPPPERETVKILVFEIENPVGLVVTEIIDSLEVAVKLDESNITPQGFSGLAMVNNRPTAFVDIYQVIEKAFPDWFQQDQKQRDSLKNKGQISILLVEDSSFYRNMEKSYLSQEGFKVLEAENGKEALDILRKESVDLVVTDIEMPEMNGFQLTEEIRRDENLRHLPVIAVTSLSKDKERQQGMDAGLDSYLIKLQRGALLKEVHRLLAERRAMA